MTEFKHFLLTRWNLLLDGSSIYNNPAVPDPDQWMRHRAELFERITLPSVQAQVTKSFTWLLAFDRTTPLSYIQRYKSLENVQIINSYPRTHLIMQYNLRILKDGDWIITTRLDNDDYIEPFFIRRIQQQFNYIFKIVDTDGVQWDLSTGKFYTAERRFANSPFLSLIEQVGVPFNSLNGTRITEPVKTCFYCSHTKMIDHFPAVKIQERLYRMVIHDRNVSNKIVGREING